MGEVWGYTFTWKELTSALVQALDLREGFWGLEVPFRAGSTGHDETPTFLFHLPEIRLVRRTPETAGPWTIDAAEVSKAPVGDA